MINKMLSKVFQFEEGIKEGRRLERERILKLIDNICLDSMSPNSEYGISKLFLKKQLIEKIWNKRGSEKK